MSFFRKAKPNEFILKRDSDGKETIETQGVVFAVGGGNGTSDVRRLPVEVGVNDDTLLRVIEAADKLGFWAPGNHPRHGESPVRMAVFVPTVRLSLAELEDHT